MCSSFCVRSQSSSSSRSSANSTSRSSGLTLRLFLAACARATASSDRSWLPSTTTRSSRSDVHQPQRLQRLAAAIDQVAAEPQPVAAPDRSGCFSSRRCSSVGAALHVADGPECHVARWPSVQRARHGQHERRDRRVELACRRRRPSGSCRAWCRARSRAPRRRCIRSRRPDAATAARRPRLRRAPRAPCRWRR